MIRRRIALALFYVTASAVFFGGVGDLFIRGLLDAQREFLSGGGQYAITPACEGSFLELLHALGGSLAGVGAASLLLTHFAIRRGERWAVVAVALAIGLAEGANTVGMFRLGSPFYMVTTAYLVALAAAVVLTFVPTFAFSRSA